jgi:hypothetical protein
MENVCQHSRPFGRDLNLGPSEYDVGVLTTRQWRSVRTSGPNREGTQGAGENTY